MRQSAAVSTLLPALELVPCNMSDGVVEEVTVLFMTKRVPIFCFTYQHEKTHYSQRPAQI
jgi:hypothetical protein